jgi:hypothetical protein
VQKFASKIALCLRAIASDRVLRFLRTNGHTLAFLRTGLVRRGIGTPLRARRSSHGGAAAEEH